MKHANGRRLTRKMKMLLSSKGLNPDNWLWIKETSDELHIIHIHSISPRIIYKQ